MTNTIQENILQQLADNEMKVKELYEKYSLLFPEYHNFWMEIAEDEIEHSQAFLELKDYYHQDKINFSEHRFNQKIIDFVKNLVNQNLEIASNKKLSLTAAMENASKIENYIYEATLLDSIDTDDKPIKKTLEKLKKETQEHYIKIMTTYKKIIS